MESLVLKSGTVDKQQVLLIIASFLQPNDMTLRHQLTSYYVCECIVCVFGHEYRVGLFLLSLCVLGDQTVVCGGSGLQAFGQTLLPVQLSF